MYLRGEGADDVRDVLAVKKIANAKKKKSEDEPHLSHFLF